MTAPTYSELVAQVAALQQPTTLADLPLKSLSEWLETDWQPDANLLLPPGGIGAELLDPEALVLRGTRGASTVAFAGAGTSSTRTITHGLGAVPIVAFAGSNTNTAVLFWQVTNRTATTFDVTAFTASGTLSATVPFDWMATL